MVEELFVGVAVAAWCSDGLVLHEAVFGASAPADGVVSADDAFGGEVTFLPGEIAFGFTLH